jgi:hypothetical protein
MATKFTCGYNYAILREVGKYWRLTKGNPMNEVTKLYHSKLEAKLAAKEYMNDCSKKIRESTHGLMDFKVRSRVISINEVK